MLPGQSFDRTCIVTTVTGPGPGGASPAVCHGHGREGRSTTWSRPGGNIYHSGDSHFSIYFAKHGKDYDIDVGLRALGEKAQSACRNKN